MSEANAPSSGSLRLRFLLAVTLWVALGIGGIWFTATRVFATHIEDMYHEELEVHVRELARLTRLGADGTPLLDRPLSDPRYEEPLSGFYWQVSVPGRPVLKSGSMLYGGLDDTIAHSPDIAHVVENGPTGPAITYGLLEIASGGEELHIVIATDQSELDDDIAAFTRDLTVWMASLAALLLATGLAIISFGLRPLHRLGEGIARLRAAKADRLEGRYPSEIAPLVGDLNEYIAQNSAIVARSRVQAGNLAHSLRTPLAVIADEAERLSEGDTCASSGRVLLHQTEAMRQQIEYQLARTRSAIGVHVPGSKTMLPELIIPILSAMRRLHPDKEFDFEPLDAPASVSADPANLSELLSILLDNAGKWARTRVFLSLEIEGDDEFEIEVRDDGPGMTQGQIERAYEIGTRFDESVPGSGLGLAIARNLCADMGIELQLFSGPDGLTARVTSSGAQRKS
ncbi:sensor histidine kinase [Aurantiacibacter hainanensis]|uniref:sensor histidine kinase n=1 Tax=Aurantiacibacter hainanensis TaxID=3076114 RepID=UPI0030C76AF7